MPAIENITGIRIGATGTFLFTPVDSNANVPTLPDGFVPTTITTDHVNAPVTVSADGLVATVKVPASAPITLVGTTFNLFVSGTLPDGTLIDAVVSVPFLSPVEAPITFLITQTS
jgi:hypothetical protein